MNYGLYIASSGMSAALYRMDVAANNLANSETTGYKPDLVSTRERDAARVEDHLVNLPSNAMLERLGAGVMIEPNKPDLRQGTLEPTRGPLDVGISGEGFFLVPGRAQGEPARLSRDGRLTINTRGQLVQAASGAPVLDERSQPIIVRRDAPVQINTDGSVIQNAQSVGKIALVSVPAPTTLRKGGDNTFIASKQQLAARKSADAQLVQGTIERSGVDPVRAMVELTGAERAAGTGQRVIQTIDEMMGRAISTFGRVA